MKRIHKLAAEIFAYSYDNYIDHLGINPRFDKYMPADARKLEAAVREEWPVEKVAAALGVPAESVPRLLRDTRDALEVVDAANPAESFRNAVRGCVRAALEEGLSLDDEDSVESLVTQVCYRAADLSVLLEDAGQPLQRYSLDLRREPDEEVYDGDNDVSSDPGGGQ